MFRRSWVLPIMVAAAVVLVVACALYMFWHVATLEEQSTLDQTTRALRQAAARRLDGNRDYLLLLAAERAAADLNAESFQQVASRYVADHDELLNITWVGPDFVIEDVAPLEGNRQIVGLRLSLPEPARASRLALETRRPAYTRTFEAIQGNPSFEVWVPVFRGEEFLGLMAGVYSCRKFLAQITPPDVMERNRVALYDDRGAIVTALSARQPSGKGISKLVVLDPPANGLRLELTHHGPPFWGGQVALFVAVACVALAAGLAISLFMARRESAQRKEEEEALRQRERELAHLTRLSTMGELVAGIAHEINQPLHSIANFASASEAALQADGAADLQRLRDWNQKISDAALRAGEIIRRIRRFVKKGEEARADIDVYQVIRESIDLVASEARDLQIDVRSDSAGELPRIHADRTQIQQVIVNLLRNAYDATTGLPPGARRVVLSARLQDDDVEFTITDNGIGIDPEGSDHIFDPFFSTKGTGMGMGLAISRSIVEAHGGRIWSTQNKPQGTKFHFTVPAGRAAPASQAGQSNGG